MSKGEENFKNKLKNFLGISKEKQKHIEKQKPAKDFIFTPDILKEIGPESPGNNRIKTIKELGDVVMKKKLEENAIEAVWCSIQDLVLPQTVSEKRHVALQFLKCLLEGQFQHLGVLRGHFFHVIETLRQPENLKERLELFNVLSQNGRNLLEFEEEAGRFLLEWMPDVVVTGKLGDFLPLLISVVKYNAAYMDEEIISGIVKQTCQVCSLASTPNEEIKLCLDVLDAVVCYSFLPSDSLQQCVGALCLVVNIAMFCQDSWELMRKLLGTHLGHSCILNMCTMLDSWEKPLDYRLLRGAVFFVGMALWGCRKVQFLKYTPAAVLPSFLHVLASGNTVLTYEVTLSVQRLVKKYGRDLTASTWDIVINILDSVHKLIEHQDQAVHQRNAADFHDTMTAIEQLHEQGQFSGSVPQYFALLESCAARRPESSVILLITYQSQKIQPSKENWIDNLYQLMDKYFRTETRTKVRLKALAVLSLVIDINKHVYEDDLVGRVVLPHLSRIDADTDVDVRKTAVEILLSFCQSCTYVSFVELIDIVERVVSRPLMCRKLSSPLDGTEPQLTPDESHLADTRAAIGLLVDLFKVKLFVSPPASSMRLYDILVSQLEHHYRDYNSYNSLTASSVRHTIIECLVKLRADSLHRVGINERSQDGALKYSPFISCIRNGLAPADTVAPDCQDGPASSMAALDYSRTFFLFIQCLQKERDWGVLLCLLENLPLLLQNKTIILSAEVLLIDRLCARLCAIVNDRQLGYPEKLLGLPAKFSRSDFHTYMFPVLASMVTYHSYLARNRQKELITCLEFGMISKCAKLCVNALRLCTLEMQDVMMRLLPVVLLQLSKISATVSMAIPVLAFLSSIVRLPKMYANFVEDEYMSVFAIALPYTNPFKFSHYTVSLAHHVIAIWFIRCRLPIRKTFVQFIQKGLKAYVLQQFDENAKLALQKQNQDSSDRMRSGSLSEEALRRLRMHGRRRMQSGSASVTTHGPSDISAPVDEKLSTFHRELTECCSDLMARYVFGNFSPLPHRSNMAEFLLAGGQSQTWLVGNKVITITTSGGGIKAGSSGFCDKCHSSYFTVSGESKDTSKGGRRRHRSAQVTRSNSTMEALPKLSQDDFRVGSRSSLDDMSLDLTLPGDPGNDVAVQTGKSLEGIIQTEPLESLILGMKGSDSKSSSMNVCNCWCTNWAEIYIRAPSGNLSWMMRIENETGLYSQDSMAQVPDITMLFASLSKKNKPRREVSRSHRIESGSIGEEEYETLYAQHFPDYLKPDVTSIPEEDAHRSENKAKTASSTAPVSDVSSHPVEASESLGFVPSISMTGVTEHQVSEALEIPSTESAKNHETSPMRRSLSSPSVISSSSDNTLSPRESLADIVVSALEKETKQEPSVQPTTSGCVVPESGGMATGSQSQPIGKSADFQDTTDGSAISGVLSPDKTAKPDTSGEKHDESSKPSTLPQTAAVPHPPQEFSSMLSKQLTPSPASSDTSSTQDELGELPSNIRRRGHTVSITQPASRGSSSHPNQGRLSTSSGSSSSMADHSRIGISPSFVFLQLYNSGHLPVNDLPLLLPSDESSERSLKMLDFIYPYETHKIGVLYVGPNQVSCEKAILSNQYGSERYINFIQSLGNLVRLRDCDQGRVYLGGLDTTGKDGEFTYAWQDESIQLVFHIATLMPNKEKDPNCYEKKRHVGNNYVTVVYNDSGEDYKIGVIKGHFNYVNIVIKPLDYESNAVTLQAKEVPFQDQITTDIAGILGHTDTKIISDLNLALLIRQIAIHCNMASQVLQRQQSQPNDPFASNWLERLRHIRRLHKNVAEKMELLSDPSHAPRSNEDFTQYC